ncbi:DUF222 domain-containing protein [Geodermatophilus sp. SYSU D00698]
MCPGGPGGGGVLDEVAALVAERNRIDARLARAVRAAELSQAPERDGLRSMASWLRGHCRLSTAEASRLVRAGRAMEHLPALAEAHDAGLVTAEQVARAAEAVTPERLASAGEQGVDLTVVDAVSTGVAVQQPHADLVAVVQHYLDALAAGSLPQLRGHKPQVAVVVDLADLVDPHGRPDAGRMGFGATVSAARARWLACDGAVSRVVSGPDGAPLENSALLCERHHTEVHHGFRVERRPDGRWRTHRPDGTEITTPAPLLAPAA